MSPSRLGASGATIHGEKFPGWSRQAQKNHVNDVAGPPRPSARPNAMMKYSQSLKRAGWVAVRSKVIRHLGLGEVNARKSVLILYFFAVLSTVDYYYLITIHIYYCSQNQGSLIAHSSYGIVSRLFLLP